MKKKLKKPNVCVLDGDSLLFEAASAGEQVWYIYKDKEGNEVARFDAAHKGKNWLEECKIMGVDVRYGYEGDLDELERHTEYEIKDFEECEKVFKSGLKKILRWTKCKEMRCYISKESGLPVFRHALATIHEYKKGRGDTRKPHYLNEVRRFARTLPEVITTTGDIETDDKVIEVVEKLGQRGCLVAVDKDALQVVGAWMFHIGVHKKPVYSRPDILGRLGKPEDNKIRVLGHLSLLLQLLKGDKSVDGIVGLPRYGEVKAFDILSKYDNKKLTPESFKSALTSVLAHYYKVYGLTHTYTHWNGSVELTRSYLEMFEENFTLLYMRRFKDDKGEHYMEVARSITEEELQEYLNA